MRFCKRQSLCDRGCNKSIGKIIHSSRTILYGFVDALNCIIDSGRQLSGELIGALQITIGGVHIEFRKSVSGLNKTLEGLKQDMPRVKICIS
jgi:hypothetical protein